MSSTKISKDYQDGYDLGYKNGYVDGAKDFQPKKGKWIKQDNGYIMCPFCKTDTKHGAWWEYCPKCGANMVVDLCSICKHGDNCERSDKGISFANHSSCWKFER